jgi:lipopolysaccharide biosynthesis glycosyltransferase
MKQLIYQVYTGKRKKLYDFCTASVKEYAKRIGADHIIQRTPILMIKPDVFQTNRSNESYMKYGGFLPIYEKENAFAYFKSYDKIAIIDGDIFIRDSAPNLFDQITDEYDFAGVVEREMPLNQKYQQKITNYSRMQYQSIRNVDWKWNKLGAEFFNMGMMLMNKSMQKYLNGETPLQFLNRPRFKPFIDGLGAWKWSTDQTLLNTWIREEKMKLKHLDWKWNGLYNAVPNELLHQAHFIHFFHKTVLPMEGENIEELAKLVGIT